MPQNRSILVTDACAGRKACTATSYSPSRRRRSNVTRARSTPSACGGANATSAGAFYSPTPSGGFHHRILPEDLPAKDPEIASALSLLCRTDKDIGGKLAAVIGRAGPPQLTQTRNPHGSLSRSIIYQQLSMRSANAIFTRFSALFDADRSIADSRGTRLLGSPCPFVCLVSWCQLHVRTGRCVECIA